LGDGQGAVGIDDVVIVRVAATDCDGVSAGSGRGAGVGGQRNAADHAGVIAVLTSRCSDLSQGWVSITINLALVVGGDGEGGGLGEGQGAVGVDDVVVVRSPAADGDGVRACRGRGAGVGGQINATDHAGAIAVV